MTPNLYVKVGEWCGGQPGQSSARPRGNCRGFDLRFCFSPRPAAQAERRINLLAETDEFSARWNGRVRTRHLSSLPLGVGLATSRALFASGLGLFR
jgi:hypothetical protein